MTSSPEGTLPGNAWEQVSLPPDQIELFVSRLDRYDLAVCVQSIDEAAQHHFARRPTDAEITVLSGDPIPIPQAVQPAKSLMRALDIGYRVRGRFLGSFESGNHEKVVAFAGALPSPQEVLELPQAGSLREFYGAGYGAYGAGYVAIKAAGITSEPATLQLGFAQPETGKLAEMTLDLTEPRRRYPTLVQARRRTGGL